MISAGKTESREGTGVRFYNRKIEKFSIRERPFDVAFFMSETFPVMISNRDLLSHLRSVGEIAAPRRPLLRRYRQIGSAPHSARTKPMAVP